MFTESLTPKTLVMTNVGKLFGIILGMIMDGMATGTEVDDWADGTFVIHAFLLYVCEILVLSAILSANTTIPRQCIGARSLLLCRMGVETARPIR